MTTNLNTIQASITTLTINGITITKDMARQLDELFFEGWENFEPIGRVRTGTKHFDEGIEILGCHKETGALVRMWHVTVTHRVTQTGADGRISFVKPAPVTPEDNLRDTLTAEYEQMPLMVLPRGIQAMTPHAPTPRPGPPHRKGTPSHDPLRTRSFRAHP